MLGNISWVLSLYLPYVTMGLVLALLLTRTAIFVLPRIGFIDVPHGRHQHAKPVPRGGGIAIWFSFFLTVALLTMMFKHNGNSHYGETLRFLLNFLGPALIILLTGVLDDRYELRSVVKLLAQIAAGCVLYFSGVGITSLYHLQLPVAVALPLTVLWCVIIINAFNLIDGLDGIASGLAVISSFLLAIWVGSTGGSEVMVMILLIFSGCNLGFLRYNFSPAKIFMGDTGSMFLGLFFAYVSMLCSAKSVTLTTFFVPLAAIGIPIFDVFLAIWRRFFRRYINKQSQCSIMQGDHDHLHHRIFHETGSTHKTACIIYALSLFFSLFTMGSVLLRHQVPALFFLLLLTTFFVMIRCASIEVFDTLRCVVKGLQVPHRNILFTVAHPVLDVLI
ncbi:MAG: undecaprenyl/decaprenyl-phosphate alpha-N-acetylglucosaminyl 1-phosphate transferase, partial [Lentisphaeria bacterium]|nr:undecaprenyl/decaprenyl-phosphate alpha-N-acetylglucosaminyl 1-phosphate transferase [Lentisphaeria bacterium]